jgi:hypothetical protein
MNMMPIIGSIAAPTNKANDFMAYENECRDVLRPWLKSLMDSAASAGWDRHTVASTLMFLAAQNVSRAER